jgi:hypothetical protein
VSRLAEKKVCVMRSDLAGFASDVLSCLTCTEGCLENGRYPCNEEGSPASPNTGALVEVNRDGSFTVIADGLDQPTSLEFIENTAYVVTLTGQIWKIHSVLGLPHDSRER